jgi:hypothetical protein
MLSSDCPLSLRLENLPIDEIARLKLSARHHCAIGGDKRAAIFLGIGGGGPIWQDIEHLPGGTAEAHLPFASDKGAIH